jgi:hypothetical protein
MTCIICGSPDTVEAHIFPRALYRMAAGTQQHAYQGSRFKEGVKYQAKGAFDPDLLCRRHEDAFRDADDYGIRFIRNFDKRATPVYDGHALSVQNPKPQLLERFVAGCIWRRGISPVEAEAADLDLGDAEPLLRDLLFNPASIVTLPFTVGRRTFTSEGTPLREILLEPSKGVEDMDGWWSFFAFGIEFLMRTRSTAQFQIPPLIVANGKNPIVCLHHEPEELTDVPGLLDIAVNMYRERYAAEQAAKARKSASPK